MIEPETVHNLSALRSKPEMPVTVRFRGAKHRATILGTVRYDHAWDRLTRRIEDSAFDSLGKLRLFNNYKLSNRFCRSDEYRTRNHAHY